MKYKIYKITSDQTDEVYIGHTELTLKQRLSKHKNHYTLYCYEKYHFVYSNLVVCYDDCKIELIEETDDKLREKFWIRKIDCCNERMNKQPKDYICKAKSKSCSQGFYWRFQYVEDSKILVNKCSVDKDFLIDFATNWFIEQGIDM